MFLKYLFVIIIAYRYRPGSRRLSTVNCWIPLVYEVGLYFIERYITIYHQQLSKNSPIPVNENTYGQ